MGYGPGRAFGVVVVLWTGGVPYPSRRTAGSRWGVMRLGSVASPRGVSVHTVARRCVARAGPGRVAVGRAVLCGGRYRLNMMVVSTPRPAGPPPDSGQEAASAPVKTRHDLTQATLLACRRHPSAAPLHNVPSSVRGLSSGVRCSGKRAGAGQGSEGRGLGTPL